MKLYNYLLTIFLVLSSYSAFSQDLKDKIVVVDIQSVLKDSTAATDIREQIKKKRDQYQQSIKIQEESLRKEETKLKEQRSVLSQEAFAKKRDSFQEKFMTVQRDVQVKRAKLDSALNKSLANVQIAVYKIIDDLAREKGFNIALPTSQVLFARETLSITDEVLKRLNRDLPKVKVELDK